MPRRIYFCATETATNSIHPGSVERRPILLPTLDDSTAASAIKYSPDGASCLVIVDGGPEVHDAIDLLAVDPMTNRGPGLNAELAETFNSKPAPRRQKIRDACTAFGVPNPTPQETLRSIFRRMTVAGWLMPDHGGPLPLHGEDYL